MSGERMREKAVPRQSSLLGPSDHRQRTGLVMRIGVGGFSHESHAFLPTVTSLDEFVQSELSEGEELLARHEERGTELGGAIDAARDLPVELAPLMFASAQPGGPIPEATFEVLKERLVSAIRCAGPLDGVLLVLHGASAVQARADPEADLVAEAGRAARAPVAATFDLHGNLSSTLAELLSVAVGYRTYPHTDMAACGAAALALLADEISERRSRRVAVAKLPLLTAPQAQETASPPMRALLSAAREFERRPGIDAVSLLPGYPYTNGNRLGFSVLVTATQGGPQAAREMGQIVWRAREDFAAPTVTLAEAMRLVEDGPWPTVLVDVADNVGGGSPGDGTWVLRALEQRRGRDAVVVIWDPPAARDLVTDYVERPIEVGGRVSEVLGPPVTLIGSVSAHGPVSYRRTSEYMRGQTVNLGRVAVIDCGAGQVVVTERRVLPFDLDHLTAVGVQPARKRVIVAKAAIAWKEAFGELAAQAAFLRLPGFCPSDLADIPFTRRPAPLWPLEPNTAWP